MSQDRIFLISGLPGSGKTTLVKGLAERIGIEKCAGFFTQEIRQSGTRTGFSWQTFSGKHGLLADLNPGQPRVGKYRVDLASFETMLEDLRVVPSGKLLLVDEVGKMECLSARFRELLSFWESSSGTRLFTVPEHGTPFIEAFKARHRETVLHLSHHTRQTLLAELIALLS